MTDPVASVYDDRDRRPVSLRRDRDPVSGHGCVCSMAPAPSKSSVAETFSGEDDHISVPSTRSACTMSASAKVQESPWVSCRLTAVARRCLTRADAGTPVKIMLGAFSPLSGLVIGARPSSCSLGADRRVRYLEVSADRRSVASPVVSVFERLFRVSEGETRLGWTGTKVPIWPGEGLQARPAR